MIDSIHLSQIICSDFTFILPPSQTLFFLHMTRRFIILIWVNWKQNHGAVRVKIHFGDFLNFEFQSFKCCSPEALKENPKAILTKTLLAILLIKQNRVKYYFVHHHNEITSPVLGFDSDTGKERQNGFGDILSDVPKPIGWFIFW